jgi:hypothetical protein
MKLALRACQMLAVGLLATLPASGADAAAIANRTALQTILGGGGTIETFEAFSFPTFPAANTGCMTLTSASTCAGQGPGLVQPGLTFSSNNFLQWNDAGFQGAPSREINTTGVGLVVDFATTQDAFGVDVRAFTTSLGGTVDLDIYGADDTTLLGSITGIVLPTSGIPVFVGWQDAAGIGKFVLTAGFQSLPSPIDNLEYGASAAIDTPEPASAAMLGLGLAVLAIRRRKHGAAKPAQGSLTTIG